MGDLTPSIIYLDIYKKIKILKGFIGSKKKHLTCEAKVITNDSFGATDSTFIREKRP